MTAVPAPGDVLLEKYSVERVIGQGGMGMVLAVRHQGLGELFAIKLMLNPEGPAGQQAIDRFLREARICASLKGDHVVKVQDVGQLPDGRPYMVMEHLQGQDLASIIEKRGALPLADAGAIVLQTCEALGEAHKLGIVHRDIKPANIFLIRKPNGKLSVKLLDFGISKRIDANTKALTATGALMGSPLYMSPEQLTDARTVGHASDIWAMGVVLYELVTAEVPFCGEMVFEVIAAILNKDHRLPSEIRRGLPTELDSIVSRCLRKRPEERYASIADFALNVREMLRTTSVIGFGANLLAAGKAEDEINIVIDSVIYDAANMGPTIKAEAPISPSDAEKEEAPRQLVHAPTVEAPKQEAVLPKNSNTSTNKGVTNTPVVAVANSVTDAPKRSSGLVVALSAILLLAAGAGIVYLLPAGSPSEKNRTTTESAPAASIMSITSTRQTSPAPAAGRSSPEPSQSALEPASSIQVAASSSPEPAASPAATASSPYLFPSLFRPNSKPPASATPKPNATTTTPTTHEGLL